MKAAIYARVSTDDKGQNPETQLLQLREFCERAGWEIYESMWTRPGLRIIQRRTAWTQLAKDANRRMFKFVAVYKLDRAFRSVTGMLQPCRGVGRPGDQICFNFPGYRYLHTHGQIFPAHSCSGCRTGEFLDR